MTVFKNALMMIALLASITTQTAQADDQLQAALSPVQRLDANRARDAARHPPATLQFFGIAPGMTVVELSPGDGWYTEILAG